MLVNNEEKINWFLHEKFWSKCADGVYYQNNFKNLNDIIEIINVQILRPVNIIGNNIENDLSKKHK